MLVFCGLALGGLPESALRGREPGHRRIKVARRFEFRAGLPAFTFRGRDRDRDPGHRRIKVARRFEFRAGLPESAFRGRDHDRHPGHRRIRTLGGPSLRQGVRYKMLHPQQKRSFCAFFIGGGGQHHLNG